MAPGRQPTLGRREATRESVSLGHGEQRQQHGSRSSGPCGGHQRRSGKHSAARIRGRWIALGHGGSTSDAAAEPQARWRAPAARQQIRREPRARGWHQGAPQPILGPVDRAPVWLHLRRSGGAHLGHSGRHGANLGPVDGARYAGQTSGAAPGRGAIPGPVARQTRRDPRARCWPPGRGANLGPVDGASAPAAEARTRRTGRGAILGPVEATRARWREPAHRQPSLGRSRSTISGGSGTRARREPRGRRMAGAAQTSGRWREPGCQGTAREPRARCWPPGHGGRPSAAADRTRRDPRVRWRAPPGRQPKLGRGGAHPSTAAEARARGRYQGTEAEARAGGGTRAPQPKLGPLERSEWRGGAH